MDQIKIRVVIGSKVDEAFCLRARGWHITIHQSIGKEVRLET